MGSTWLVSMTLCAPNISLKSNKNFFAKHSKYIFLQPCHILNTLNNAPRQENILNIWNKSKKLMLRKETNHNLLLGMEKRARLPYRKCKMLCSPKINEKHSVVACTQPRWSQNRKQKFFHMRLQKKSLPN